MSVFTTGQQLNPLQLSTHDEKKLMSKTWDGIKHFLKLFAVMDAKMFEDHSPESQAPLLAPHPTKSSFCLA